MKRSPNLHTVIMIENTLKKHLDVPLKVSELKKLFLKQIMHRTLKLILIYLWKGGKIIYGLKGVQWIYSEPAHLKKMLENTIKI